MPFLITLIALIALIVVMGGLVIFDRVLRVRAMRRGRLPREVSVEQVQDVSLIPSDIQAYFHWADETLPLFASLGTFTRGYGPQVTLYTRAFEDPTTNDLVIASVTRVHVGSRLRQTYLLQFITVLENDIEISTINTVINFPSLRSPLVRRTVIPEIADVSILQQVHDAMVARHARTTGRKIPWQPEFLSWWRTEMIEDQCKRIQAGHLRVDQKSGALQPTWKYIFVWMLMTFWPVVKLRHAYFQWKANRVLRSLELPLDYVRGETTKTVTAPPPPVQTIFCPHCDYNLTGLSESRCPECGQLFDPVQLGEWNERLPKPITTPEAIGQIMGPIGCLVPLIAIGAGLAFLMRKVAEVDSILFLAGTLGVVGMTGFLIKESYTSCCLLSKPEQLSPNAPRNLLAGQEPRRDVQA